jgi:predicted amidohydrolase
MMIRTYTAVCIQSDNTAVSHRREIRKANLDRHLELIEYAVGGLGGLGFPEYAPTRLVVFPEYFMQGWTWEAKPYSTKYEKLVKDIALQIPGEETNILGEVAKEYNLYIAGSASEVMPEFPDFPLNCAFIIDPRGEIIYKHHKYNPFLAKDARDAVSPHDVWDRYVEVMDGRYGRKKGDIVSCFFPVVETDIGKLGSLICNEGRFPEHARVLGLQGCEVMLRHSGCREPFAGPPQEMWEIENRSHAVFNTMYLVACATGWHFSPGFTRQVSRGYSMVLDFDGGIRALADYSGETVTGAVIDIESLRRRRADPKFNWLTQLRTEVYVEMYKKPIYPKNLFLEKPAAELSFPERCAAQPVKKWLEERIFIPPSK